MKDGSFTRLICEAACSFYKPGKEDMRCAGYTYLTRTYSPDMLQKLTVSMMMNPLAEKGFAGFKNPGAEALLCEHCDFRIDGCDFAEDCSGPPCGGYRIVFCLLTNIERNRKENNNALGK